MHGALNIFEITKEVYEAREAAEIVMPSVYQASKMIFDSVHGSDDDDR